MPASAVHLPMAKQVPAGKLKESLCHNVFLRSYTRYKILISCAFIKIRDSALVSMVDTSLVPRPFFAGEEKTAWYTLLTHARYSHKNLGIRARLHITATFERNLPLYSRILRHVGRWLGMVNKLSMVR